MNLCATNSGSPEDELRFLVKNSKNEIYDLKHENQV
jgi:hypothetical protein